MNPRSSTRSNSNPTKINKSVRIRPTIRPAGPHYGMAARDLLPLPGVRGGIHFLLSWTAQSFAVRAASNAQQLTSTRPGEVVARRGVGGFLERTLQELVI